MKISNTVSDYTAEEREIIGQQLSDMIDNLKEIDTVLNQELKSPTPSNPENNVIHVDFSPVREFIETI